MKAIKITAANQGMLMSRYGAIKEDANDLFPIGMWLIANFGNEDYFDTVTQEVFDEHFVKVEEIENGFISIVRK